MRPCRMTHKDCPPSASPPGEVAYGNALGDDIDEGLARLFLEAVMELSEVSIAFGTIDKRRDACGEGGTRHNIGNVTYNSLDALAR